MSMDRRISYDPETPCITIDFTEPRRGGVIWQLRGDVAFRIDPVSGELLGLYIDGPTAREVGESWQAYQRLGLPLPTEPHGARPGPGRRGEEDSHGR